MESSDNIDSLIDNKIPTTNHGASPFWSVDDKHESDCSKDQSDPLIPAQSDPLIPAQSDPGSWHGQNTYGLNRMTESFASVSAMIAFSTACRFSIW